MILQGNFEPITSINADGKGAITVFGDKNGVIKDSKGNPIQVLDSTVPLCETGKSGCWESGTSYVMPDGSKVGFAITNGRFECIDTTSAGCKALTQ